MHVELAKYRALLEEISSGEIEGVLGGNIARVIGLYE
jgi:hypothetical protein